MAFTRICFLYLFCVPVCFVVLFVICASWFLLSLAAVWLFNTMLCFSFRMFFLLLRAVDLLVGVFVLFGVSFCVMLVFRSCLCCWRMNSAVGGLVHGL